MKKICIKCIIEKSIEEFGKDIRKIDKISNICKECNNTRSRNYNKNNKESKKKTGNKYYLNNKEKMNKNSINWMINNKDKFRKYYSEYRKLKRKNDIIFIIKESIRKLICNSISRSKFAKNNRTLDILGCSFLEFKNYIESKFETWMNWENRGLYNGELNYGWDIDHIIPISSAKTEDEVIKLNHYTNLQPLCSKINRDIKRNTISI